MQIKTRSGRIIELPTPEEDAAITEAAMADSDSRPYTDEEWAKVKPHRGHRLQGGTKEQITVRFDTEVIDAFRATGDGWQTRMNDALRDWLKEHPVRQ